MMRKSLVVMLALAAALSAGVVQPPAVIGATYIFPLSLNGKVYRTFPRNPGEKAPLHTANDKIIGPIIQGLNFFDFSASYVRGGPDGRYFLYYDGKHSWRVATNTSATNVTTLTGQVANLGTFWMFGKYDLPMLGPLADVLATGKVTFVKGSFDPKSIKGTLYFVSSAIEAGMILKFKTVGSPTIIP